MSDLSYFWAVLGVWTVGLIVQISSKIAGSPHLQTVQIHRALANEPEALNDTPLVPHDLPLEEPPAYHCRSVQSPLAGRATAWLVSDTAADPSTSRSDAALPPTRDHPLRIPDLYGVYRTARAAAAVPTPISLERPAALVGILGKAGARQVLGRTREGSKY